ncbi:MAG TPA: hypothetical protein VGB34_06215 [Candidatus Limnocylindria bacterium]|jgi:hypothetical protein
MIASALTATRSITTFFTEIRLPTNAVAFLFFVGSTIAFLNLGVSDNQDIHDDLARAFMEGRLWVPWGSHWELVVIDSERAWSPFPPVPALIYIPFLALGLTPSSTTLGAFVGGAGVALMLLILRHLEVPLRTAAWITLGVGAATYGWVAASSSLWFYPEVLGTVLSLAALYLGVQGRWPLLAGLLLGLAAGSRLPTGFMLPLLAWFYWPQRWRIGQLLIGLTAVAIPLALYNFVRFGSPFEFGYGLIESFWHPGELVTAEPYFRDGIVNLAYIPRSIFAMLLQGYEVRLDFPWIAYPVSGVGVALSAPTLLLALRARGGAIVWIAWLSFVLIMLPNWAHGSWGFWQFGYRFIVDATGPLLVLLAVAYRNKGPDWLLRGTALFGAVATLYAWAAELWWDVRAVPPAVLP